MARLSSSSFALCALWVLFASLPGCAQDVAAREPLADRAGLQATTIRQFPAPDADQGAAVNARSVFAVDNSVIAQHDKVTGGLQDRWSGPEHLLEHMNSCTHFQDQLWCANSNYSSTPMASSIEVFSTDPLSHVQSYGLGILDEGSIVWTDKVAEGWIAGFAHYDGKGGLEHKNHAYSSVVLYDEAWRRVGGWAFPASVLDRMQPYSASGGAIGPDGLLYVMGHDRPEMYALARPVMGPTLIHVATIAIEAEGQAFSWDMSVPGRRVFVVDRRTGHLREIDVPPVTPGNDTEIVHFSR
jgi:hypothetical protein